MTKKQPFSEALLAFIKANPGEIFTLTPEQLAERTGYTLEETREYYQGIAAEKQRRAAQEEEARMHAVEADVITYIPSSQHVRVTYYPQLGEVKIESNYQRERKYTQEEVRLFKRQEMASVLLSPQDSIEIGIYLSGLQPHIRDTQARIAVEPAPTEPELLETYLPPLTPPDRIKLADFARLHGISATEAVKYFDKHLIAGERERTRSGWPGGVPTFLPPVFPAKDSSRDLLLVFSPLSQKRWAFFPIPSGFIDIQAGSMLQPGQNWRNAYCASI